MKTDFPTAPLAPGHTGAGGGTVEKSFSASHTEILTLPDPQIAKRIRSFLEERLANIDDPRSIGDALKGSKLGAFWKYRVGDWRIIAHIEDDILRILVVRIGHRKEVYRD